MALADTGFIAHVGPVTYQDKGDREPDDYSIDVEKPEDGSSWVYFQRDLRLDELPDGFLKKPVGQIVSYDPASAKVVFTVGERRFEYQLPRH
jgi:hypothetical protein